MGALQHLAAIAPASVLRFLVAQLFGGLLAIAAIRFCYPDVGQVPTQVVVRQMQR